MQIGFIGLGRMGAAMAAKLVKAGHDVVVFNRSPGGPCARWTAASLGADS